MGKLFNLFNLTQCQQYMTPDTALAGSNSSGEHTWASLYALFLLTQPQAGVPALGR